LQGCVILIEADMLNAPAQPHVKPRFSGKGLNMRLMKETQHYPPIKGQKVVQEVDA